MNSFLDIITELENYKNAMAIVGDNKYATYSDIMVKINKYRAKICFDKKHTTKVGLLINDPESFLCMFLGLVFQNYIPVLLDPAWSEQMLGQIIKNLRIRQVIIEKCFAINSSYKSFRKLDDFSGNNQDLITPEIDEVHNLPEDPLYIGFTSGTTSYPKAFLQTQNAWLNSFGASTSEFNIKRGDSILIPGRLNYGFSLYPAIESLFRGTTLYLFEKYNIANILSVIQNNNRLTVYAVPTILFDIVHEIKKKGTTCNNIEKIVTSGAKLKNPLSDALSKYLPNAKIFEYYGASELGFVSVRELAQKVSINNSVGVPFKGVEIQIHKKNASNKIGTIWVKSKYISFGYIFNNGGSAFHQDGEWATVGDLGYFDGSELCIIGRQEDMMISGGNNIYFSEIEDALKDMDGISDIIATGINDKRLGQVLCVVIAGENAIRYSDIYSYCQEHLPVYKIPKRFYRCMSLPQNNNGKVSRKIINSNIEGGKYYELL